MTVSVGASRSEYEDRGGTAIREYLGEIPCSLREAVMRVIPDERPLLDEMLADLCDKQCCCLVATAAGTGPSSGLRRHRVDEK